MSNKFSVGDTVNLSSAAINSHAFRDFPGNNLTVSELIPSESHSHDDPGLRVRVTHHDWPGWVSQAVAATWLELA